MQIPGRHSEKLSRLKNTNIGDLILGSGINSIAKVTATGLGFVGSIFIARFYSAETLGTIATISSMFSILALFALLGNHTYILRTIPQIVDSFDGNHARRVFLKVSSLVFFSVVAVVVLVSAILAVKEDTHIVAKEFELLVFGLLFVTCFKKISIFTLRALGDYKIFSIFEILPSLLMMLFVLIAIALNLQDHLFIYFYYAPHFILSSIAFSLAYKSFAKLAHKKSKESKSHLNYSSRPRLPSYSGILKVSIPMLGVTLSNAVISNTDILMLAAFQDKATVGIYSVYIKLGALISIAISAVNSMYAPKAAKLFGSGKMLELKTLTKRATLLTFTFSFSILIAILLFHKLILSLYGPAFLAHVAAFYILLFSTILNAFYGSIGMLLNMTGKQNEFFLIMLSAATLNIVLNYFLIPLLGPIGAALASLATVFFWNSAAAILVKSSYGFTTFPSLSTSK